MARIPIAYGAVLSVGAACLGVSAAWIAALLCAALFLALTVPFTQYLARRRGWGFALRGLPLNFVDALVSGAGVAWGFFDFVLRKRAY